MTLFNLPIGVNREMRDETERPVDLADRIAAGATGSSGVRFLCDSDDREISWEQIHGEALAIATVIQQAGVGAGDRVALVGRTSRSLVTTLQAVWLAGAAVVVAPVALGGRVPSGVHGVRDILTSARPTMVICDREWVQPLAEAAVAAPTRTVLSFDQLAPRRGDSDRFVGSVRASDASAIVGFTSGSVTAPKGVVIGDRQLAANHAASRSALQLTESDRFCSWLPLYHDMGLIGVLALTMTAGIDLDLASPEQFAGSPRAWLDWISAHHATISVAPSFAYALGAKAMASSKGLDLSALRLAVNGAEPVDVEAFRGFLAAGARHGLRPEAAYPCYGMAESTLAVTLPRAGVGLEIDVIDRAGLETQARADPVQAGGTAFAMLGAPVEGTDLRIVGPEDGSVLQERRVGEVQVRGTSLMKGYFNRPDLTSAAFTDDGWLRTGDVGYVVQDQLVVCGRIKELIIVGGRNIVPQDVERIVMDVDGVRAGGVVAFGAAAGGTEGLVVVAELRRELAASTDAVDRARVRAEVATQLRTRLDVVPREVVLVGRGSVPRTTSGKLRRQHARALWEAGAF